MALDMGLSADYCKNKFGKKATYKKWITFQEKNKALEKEKVTTELISMGLTKKQSEEIADVKVNHPEIYEGLEDIIEERVRRENKTIITLTKVLEGVELENKKVDGLTIAHIIKALK